MKIASHSARTKALLGLLMLSLCMMPLLGLHIHLPEAHTGDELHLHQTEMHGFHVHTSQHDNIDVEAGHLSNSPQINLELESQLHKIIKILGLFCLVFSLISSSLVRVILQRHHYVVPVSHFFEIFRAMRRGPPTC